MMRATVLKGFVIVKNGEIVGRTIFDTENEGNEKLREWYGGTLQLMPGMTAIDPLSQAAKDGHSVQFSITYAHPRMEDALAPSQQMVMDLSVGKPLPASAPAKRPTRKPPPPTKGKRPTPTKGKAKVKRKR